MLIPSDEFLMLLRRALNTLDPQKAPQWAIQACEGLERGNVYWLFDAEAMGNLVVERAVPQTDKTAQTLETMGFERT